MLFKIDENISKSAVKILSSFGHNAETVFYEKLQGIKDVALIKKCTKENRCLITLDNDFANIMQYPPDNFKGIILLKVETQGKKEVNSLLEKIAPFFNNEDMVGKLWIVDKQKITIRNGS